jgi:hypothetical protein
VLPVRPSGARKALVTEASDGTRPVGGASPAGLFLAVRLIGLNNN